MAENNSKIWLKLSASVIYFLVTYTPLDFYVLLAQLLVSTSILLIFSAKVGENY